jgi:hypothetical protein
MSNRERTYTLDANGKAEMIIVEGVGNVVKIQHKTKVQSRMPSIVHMVLGGLAALSWVVLLTKGGDNAIWLILSTFCCFLVASSKLFRQAGKNTTISVATCSESILLFPKLGLQLIDIKGRSRFVQTPDIDFFAINEGFERCRVVVYLVLVTSDKRCILLFNDTRPSTEGLSMAFEALDSWLSNSRSATTAAAAAARSG